jgi:hypothetical protein
MFVCYSSTGIKTTLLTEVGLWRALQQCGGGLKEEVIASDLVWRDPSALMLSCDDSLERRYIEFNAEAPCSASRKRGAGLGKPSISCHPPELRGGAGVIESMTVSRLSKSPAPSAIALSARRLISLASASEALMLPPPRGQLDHLHRVRKISRPFL